MAVKRKWKSDQTHKNKRTGYKNHNEIINVCQFFYFYVLNTILKLQLFIEWTNDEILIMTWLNNFYSQSFFFYFVTILKMIQKESLSWNKKIIHLKKMRMEKMERVKEPKATNGLWIQQENPVSRGEF